MDPSTDSNQIRDLCDCIASIDDSKEISKLLWDLCTIREVQEMAQRLEVAVLLNEGESYIAIQKRTGASPTTISRVSKSLNYGSGGYRLALDKIQKDKTE